MHFLLDNLRQHSTEDLSFPLSITTNGMIKALTSLRRLQEIKDGFNLVKNKNCAVSSVRMISVYLGWNRLKFNGKGNCVHLEKRLLY